MTVENVEKTRSMSSSTSNILVYTLNEVFVDERARDGTWCTMKYPNHPKGCPNFNKKDTCPPLAPKVEDLINVLGETYAVVYTFDLKAHAEKMKKKHEHWSRRQCRNPLYWQNSVRSKLRKMSHNLAVVLNTISAKKHIVLEIPEANGVNVFKTMAKTGVFLKSDPDIVRKVMLIGKIRER